MGQACCTSRPSEVHPLEFTGVSQQPSGAVLVVAESSRHNTSLGYPSEHPKERNSAWGRKEPDTKEPDTKEPDTKEPDTKEPDTLPEVPPVKDNNEAALYGLQAPLPVVRKLLKPQWNQSEKKLKRRIQW